MTVVVTVAIGYLLGAVPMGLLVGRLVRGIDVREYGSGKTGFTNVLRTVGPIPAILVVAFDVAKGALPVVLARLVFGDPLAAALGGTAAVIGHTWPVFAGFRGGRGVATAFGAFVAVAPLVAVVVLGASLAVLAVTRYVSLMSVLGVLAGFLALAALVRAGVVEAEYLLFGLLVMLSVELNHLGNIRRLLHGTEPKLGRGGARRTSGQP